jgi:hypothetical protein
MKEIVCTTTVTRHHPQLSRLVTIPLAKVAPWKLTGTTVIEGTINDTPLGRRSLKRWDERECWWIDLPEPLCKKARVDTGDEVKLVIRLASEDLPQKLKQLLAQNSKAETKWKSMTAAQQRMLREEIFAAKTPATRTKRAENWLV